MAGGSVGLPSGGRRKSLDAEINLVPFIDLLSMCISFLLLTAVWINIGAVQIKQSHGTEAAPTTSAQYDLDVHFTTAGVQPAIEVQLKRGRTTSKRVIQGANQKELIAHFDAALTSWKETATADQVASVKIAPKTSVAYGDLVDVMDVFRRHQIVNIAVLPGDRS